MSETIVPRHEPIIDPALFPDWTWYWHSGPNSSGFYGMDTGRIVPCKFEPIEDEI